MMPGTVPYVLAEEPAQEVEEVQDGQEVRKAEDEKEKKKQEAQEPKKKFLYEEITVKSLSHLFWALSKLDIKNQVHIDNFMLINECDIYKDYYSHDFEWREIRKSGAAFIEDNKDLFPLRFEFMQPLKVTDYDFEKEGFDVAEKYKIYSTRRFEVFATNLTESICGKQGNIAGYPRGLVVEFSRPFNLTFLPVNRELADIYISNKLKYFQELPAHQQNEQFMHEGRDIYLVMKVKFFASRGEARTREGVGLGNVLAVLEGYEIYGDIERKMLLYSESFRSRKRKSKMEQDLIKKYQESKKKKKAEEKSSLESNQEESEIQVQDSEAKADQGANDAEIEIQVQEAKD